MSITSLLFFAACLPAILVYWLLPARYRIPWLLAASLGFLLTWTWELAAILLTVATVNYFLGRWLGRAGQRRKALLWIGIGFNLVVLAGLKYSDFFAPALVSLLGRMGIATRTGSLQFLTAVGLSFATLQLISYLVDVYTGRDDHDTLARLTGQSYDELDKQYRAFLEGGKGKGE